jgi:hypothetical protein
MPSAFYRGSIRVMETDTPCTAAQRAAIIRSAAERAQFLRWLAEKLLVTDDIAIRREAARALIQLTEPQ